MKLVLEARYKLRVLGVPLEDTSLLVGDNMSVVINTTLPSSMLKKRHNAIAYHRVREAIAAKIINFAHIDSQENVADILTKPLVSEVFHRLLKNYLFRKVESVKKDEVVQVQAGFTRKCRN